MALLLILRSITLKFDDPNLDSRIESAPFLELEFLFFESEQLMMADVNELARKYHAGHISGNALAEMTKRGDITKSERRKVVRLANSMQKKQAVELTERQKLRAAVKEKKMLPKLSKEERNRKFGKDMDSQHEKEAANFTVCLGCRKRGHFVKDCPRLALASVAPVAAEGPQMCFNCGSTDHALRNCPRPKDPNGELKYASCFICKKVGHISRHCPENPNGLYPHGGCCYICLQKTHLVKDCPMRTEEDMQEAKRRRQAAEDAEKGPRVSGLLDDSGGAGGDDMIIEGGLVDNTGSNDEDSDSGEQKRKHKKRKKDK